MNFRSGMLLRAKSDLPGWKPDNILRIFWVDRNDQALVIRLDWRDDAEYMLTLTPQGMMAFYIDTSVWQWVA